jgi:hypothetical protein
MPAPQRLNQGSLSPSANPVSTFLQFDSNSQPKAPARPSLMPQTPRVVAMQQGGRRDVQGVNSVAELAEALKPLTQLYDAGAEMYASDQYKQGQNEILRATANINRDTIEKSYAYAAENRAVDASNPVAGVLMDQANPFRRAGRVNQASKWVATMASQQFRAEWIKRGSELSRLDPSDPAITQARAEVTGRLANAFGLDEFSPGFQSYVIPEINRNWEWFQKKQYTANVNHQKLEGQAQTTELLTNLLMRPGGASPGEWMNVLLEQEASYGLTGEGSEVTRDAILGVRKRLLMMQADPNQRQSARAALMYLDMMPSGLAQEDGTPLTVKQAYGEELLSDQAEISRDIKTIRDNREAAALDLLDMDPALSGAAGLDPSDPQWRAVFEELRNNPEYRDLSNPQLWEVLVRQSGQAEEIQQITFDQNRLNDFFDEQEAAVGSAWNEGEARAQFRELMRNAPQAVRIEASNRWRSLYTQKRADAKSEIDSSTMTKVMDNALVEMSEAHFPELKNWVLDNPEGDILEYMTTKDAAKAKKYQQMWNQLKITGLNKIREETKNTGGAVPVPRQVEIWSEALKQVKKDMKAGLYDPIPATPELPEEDTSRTDVTPESYYNPSQPVPEEIVRSGAPVYSRTHTTELLGALVNGGAIPMQVKRSARAANMPIGQFLLRQADLLGLEIPAQMRRKALQQSNRSEGISQSLTAMAPGGGPLSQSTGVLFNILTGTAPSFPRSITG